MGATARAAHRIPGAIFGIPERLRNRMQNKQECVAEDSKGTSTRNENFRREDEDTSVHGDSETPGGESQARGLTYYVNHFVAKINTIRGAALSWYTACVGLFLIIVSLYYYFTRSPAPNHDANAWGVPYIAVQEMVQDLYAQRDAIIAALGWKFRLQLYWKYPRKPRPGRRFLAWELCAKSERERAMREAEDQTEFNAKKHLFYWHSTDEIPTLQQLEDLIPLHFDL